MRLDLAARADSAGDNDGMGAARHRGALRGPSNFGSTRAGRRTVPVPEQRSPAERIALALEQRQIPPVTSRHALSNRKGNRT
jgi:hypothetical protein